jgi:hypothetical protein
MRRSDRGFSARQTEIAHATGARRGHVLVFIHIPKTAGTTLRAVLNRNEPGKRSLALSNVFKGGGGTTMAPIGRLRKDKGPDLTGVALVRGHVPLGIREHLRKYLPKQRKELRCFTFLREPVDRTLSHYFAIRETGGWTGLPPLAADATLDDALACGYLHDNLQTRMLSGLVEPLGEVTEEMLEQAKHNLREGLVFFGLTERFDESLVLAKRRLGFRSILYGSSGRVNASRPRGEHVPAEILRAAERCNRHDIELYRYALELFDKAPERQELEFEVELAALRVAKANPGDNVETPPPHTYPGKDRDWRILLNAAVNLMRTEWELAESTVRYAVVRERMTATQTELRDLADLPTETQDLKREVLRLRAANTKTAELERQLEELEATLVEAREVELQLEQLMETASRTQALEQEVERPNAAPRSRPRRDAKRSGPRQAQSRPKRNAERDKGKPTRSSPKRSTRHQPPKQSDPPRGKTRRGAERGARGSGEPASSDPGPGREGS